MEVQRNIRHRPGRFRGLGNGGSGDPARWRSFRTRERGGPLGWRSTRHGELHHYAVTWSANGGTDGDGLIRYFRDGSLVGTQGTGGTTISTLAALENTSFWLGRSHFAADSTANASYREVRVYDEVLSPQAILANSIQGPDNENPSGGDGLLWQHPANTLRFTATDEWENLSIDPQENGPRFFRFRIQEP